MLSKFNMLYQVKLVFESLLKDECDLIPQTDYMESNYKYEQNILIDPDIPLEKFKNCAN